MGLGPSWALAAALVAEPAPPPPEIESPVARAHLERAMQHWDAGEDDAAVRELEAAYDIEPHPKILLAWGKVEQERDHCPRAIELLNRFLDTNPPDAGAAKAHEYIDKCGGQAPEPAELEPTPVPPPPTPAPRPITPRDDPPPPTPVDTGPKRAWARDPAAIALLASGFAVAATGVGLVIGARVRHDSAADEATHDAFRDRVDQSIVMERAGFGVLAGGAALMIGGAIRYFVLAGRQKRGR